MSKEYGQLINTNIATSSFEIRGQPLVANFAPSAWQFHGKPGVVVSISHLDSDNPIISLLVNGETQWSNPLTEDLMALIDFTKLQILVQVGSQERKVRSLLRYFDDLLYQIKFDDQINGESQPPF